MGAHYYPATVSAPNYPNNCGHEHHRHINQSIRHTSQPSLTCLQTSNSLSSCLTAPRFKQSVASTRFHIAAAGRPMHHRCSHCPRRHADLSHSLTAIAPLCKQDCTATFSKNNVSIASRQTRSDSHHNIKTQLCATMEPALTFLSTCPARPTLSFVTISMPTASSSLTLVSAHQPCIYAVRDSWLAPWLSMSHGKNDYGQSIQPRGHSPKSP